jgi:HTH-type transcriptional regulator / antitoxin HipB
MDILRTPRDISAKLKAIRTQRGWSQAELGKRIGLSQERISAIESAPQRITLQQLLTVLMALEMDLAVMPRESKQPSDRPW